MTARSRGGASPVRDFYGNSYPTHALGPVSKWMGLNEGDRMEKLTCMMTTPRTMHQYAIDKFGPDSDAAKVNFKLGEMVTTLIHTVQGRVIRVDLDVHSPRPQSYYYLLQGTKGLLRHAYGRLHRGAIALGPVGTHRRVREDMRASMVAEMGRQGPPYRPLGRRLLRDVRLRADACGPGASPGWMSMMRPLGVASTDAHASRWTTGTPPSPCPDYTNGRWKDAQWREDNLKPVLAGTEGIA